MIPAPTTDRHRASASAQWMNARARNVMRRPLRVGAVMLAVFVVSLLSLIAIPRQVQRAAAIVAPAPGERRDTVSIVSAIDRERGRLAAAESSLSISRARLSRPVAPAPAVDTLPPAIVARRDTLATMVGGLARLIARVEQSPLAASYRALAEAPAMAGDARVKALVDSLADVERERDAFGAVGGIDPNYVALTARATEIGRGLQEIAVTKRAELQREVAALTPPAPPPVVVQTVDTTRRAARRDSIRVVLGNRLRILDDARRANARYDMRAARARELANVSAPPLALLTAALVIGLLAGFGAALVAEMRAPKVADVREAERATGLRVLAHVLEYEPPAERVRRKADRELPPLLEAGAGGYRFLYLHASSAESGALGLVVTGRIPGISAVVAANVAALAALDTRAALFVDADPEGLGAGVMRVRPAPGVREIADGALPWSEAVVAQTVGRDRGMDLVTAGSAGSSPAALGRALGREMPRLLRRYDSVVVTMPVEALLDIGPLEGSLVVYGARAGATPLSVILADVGALRERGVRPAGLVLWDRDEPPVPSRDEQAALFAVREGGVDPELILAPAERVGR